MPLQRLEEVIQKGREKLYEAREKRVHPGRDDKVLAGWNGLMLRAFAEAASILDRDDYREVAVRNAEFVMAELVQSGQQRTEPDNAFAPEIRLYRTYKDGKAHIDAFAEDYAFYADRLISLYSGNLRPAVDCAGARPHNDVDKAFLRHGWRRIFHDWRFPQGVGCPAQGALRQRDTLGQFCRYREFASPVLAFRRARLRTLRY